MIKHFENCIYTKKVVLLFLIFCFLLPMFCYAEENGRYITSKYSDQGYDKVIYVNKELSVSSKSTCQVLEAAMIGNQLLQVLRFTPVDENVFLYPIETISKTKNITGKEALSGVIGEQIPLAGMPDDAYGLTISEYLKERGMTPLLIDQQSSLPENKNQFSRNEWVYQDDGSVFVYTWIWPIGNEDEKTVAIRYAEYTVEQLDNAMNNGKRFAFSNTVNWHFNTSQAEVNIPKSKRYNETVSWASEDKQIQVNINHAELQLLPGFATLICDMKAYGFNEQDDIVLEAKIENADEAIAAYLKWTTGDDESSMQLQCLYPGLIKSPGKVSIFGTICGQKVHLTLQ